MVRKLNSKRTFKITSRFYVIYGDYEPIYVGYTNRTVKQRFKEHKEDKDFSEYENVEVKELVDEKLSFDFTWDYGKTCDNAHKVSLREGQLVQQYGTQDSIFQKASNGGQTWAAEKGFVKCNKGNPKFADMSGAEIKAYIEEEKGIDVWLRHFVGHMEPVGKTWLNHFVSHMEPVEKTWLNHFVSHMEPVEKTWLHNFVGGMKPVEKVWLNSFVEHMEPVEKVWLRNFVGNMKPIEEVWLGNFVGGMKPIEEVWLGSFVVNMKPVEEKWLNGFVGHMKPIEEVWLGSFVSNMKNKRR